MPADYPIRTLARDDLPPLLKEIPDSPSSLYIRGELPPENFKLLTIVGSRKYTSYGRQAAETLIRGLKGHPVSVVSGLALGIDSIAHKAALEAGLHTIAVPGSGLHDRVIYPHTHKPLAHRILASGGALISEFEPNFEAAPWCFAQRNRIVAGLSHATLVVEAAERSGTLITARLATDYNRDVLTIPGSIFSKNSAGPHMLIRLGAVPITSPADLLEALGLEANMPSTDPDTFSNEERRIMECLAEPKMRDDIARALAIPAHELSITLSSMELKGYVEERGGMFVRLV